MGTYRGHQILSPRHCIRCETLFVAFRQIRPAGTLGPQLDQRAHRPELPLLDHVEAFLTWTIPPEKTLPDYASPKYRRSDRGLNWMLWPALWIITISSLTKSMTCTPDPKTLPWLDIWSSSLLASTPTRSANCLVY